MVFTYSKQQWKHQSNVLNLVKVNNKDTWTTSMMLFGFFIFTFELISHNILVFPLLTLNEQMMTGKFGSILQIMTYLHERKVETHEKFLSLSVSVELRRLLMDKIFSFIKKWIIISRKSREIWSHFLVLHFGIADWISVEKWILVSRSNYHLGVSKRPGHFVMAVKISSPKMVTSQVTTKPEAQ